MHSKISKCVLAWTSHQSMTVINLFGIYFCGLLYLSDTPIQGSKYLPQSVELARWGFARILFRQPWWCDCCCNLLKLQLSRTLSFVRHLRLTDCDSTDPHLSRKSKSECLSCGGQPTNPFTWRKGKWVAGVPVTPQWRWVVWKLDFILRWFVFSHEICYFLGKALCKIVSCRLKEMIPKYQVANDTISFVRLNSMLQVRL